MNTHQRTLALAHEDARRYHREAQFIAGMRKNGFPGVPFFDADLYLARYDSLTSG